MIKTQRITSTSAIPKNLRGYLTINVLKWRDSEWKTLCPYYLKTDGLEENINSGGVLFENFYQGSKIYPKVFSIQVYPSRYQQGDPRYLWWEYKTPETGDKVYTDEDINYENYNKWKNSLWNCPNPIRYPNGFYQKKNCQFILITNSLGIEKRIDYISGRKYLYQQEYIRLIRKTDEYTKLLNYLKKGKKLLLCEIDVPANEKRGEYGLDCDDNNNCEMSITKIKKLINDPSESCGHAIYLALALLEDFYTHLIIEGIKSFDGSFTSDPIATRFGSLFQNALRFETS